MPSYTNDVTLVAPGTVITATGNGPAVRTDNKGTIRASLDVTAASGTTPSLTAKLQTSFDGTTWRDVVSFTAATGVTSERKSFPGIDRYVRAAWTVSGTTPSFTAGITGEAV
jgi:hypothetical protein